MLEYNIKPEREVGEERERSRSKSSSSERKKVTPKKKGKAVVGTSRDPIWAGEK